MLDTIIHVLIHSSYLIQCNILSGSLFITEWILTHDSFSASDTVLVFESLLTMVRLYLRIIKLTWDNCKSDSFVPNDTGVLFRFDNVSWYRWICWLVSYSGYKNQVWLSTFQWYHYSLLAWFICVFCYHYMTMIQYSSMITFIGLCDSVYCIDTVHLLIRYHLMILLNLVSLVMDDTILSLGSIIPLWYIIWQNDSLLTMMQIRTMTLLVVWYNVHIWIF